MDIKFYCTQGAGGHGNWLVPIGGREVREIEKCDVIVFGGGADIDPATYGEERAHGTYTSAGRELKEKEDFAKGRDLGKKMVGICRGHQLLCALAGGKLIQDVTNHAGSQHPVDTFDGIRINTNSIHHQMVNPYNLKPKEYKILAWSARRLSDYYIGGINKKMYLPVTFKEIEAIYFPKIDALGFQYHPEMMFNGSRSGPAVEWTQQTFIKFFENKL